MSLESILAGLGFDTLARALKRGVSAQRRKRMLSAAIAELLKVHPDLTAAEAKILAAEATGVPPSPELLHARDMLHKAKSYAARGAKKKRKKTARRPKYKKKRGKVVRRRRKKH